MNSIVKIYSSNISEVQSFLGLFYLKNISLDKSNTYWQTTFANPVEISDVVAAFIDNKDKYPSSNMWVSLDKNVLINITEQNYNAFIKYLFERYPY